MTIAEQIRDFSDRFGKAITVNNTTWRYYHLGAGAPVLWLTGGLRRAALGFAFMERLATWRTVIAPDYPPVQTIGAFMAALDAILQSEGAGTCALGGQSYGGLLAQAYVAHKGEAVERLILSSSGPADYGRAWLPVEQACIALVRVLPEQAAKRLLIGGLVRAVSLPEPERAEWLAAIAATVRGDLSRADLVSHFAVASDLIRSRLVTPAAYQKWTGRIIVLSAENDPTQSKKDIPRYERLFGRPVTSLSMGNMGHTASLFDPGRYAELLEQALLLPNDAPGPEMTRHPAEARPGRIQGGTP